MRACRQKITIETYLIGHAGLPFSLPSGISGFLPRFPPTRGPSSGLQKVLQSQPDHLDVLDPQPHQIDLEGLKNKSPFLQACLNKLAC